MFDFWCGFVFELYSLQSKKDTENNKFKEDYTNDEINYQDSFRWVMLKTL
jgi:hypothetical protein